MRLAWLLLVLTALQASAAGVVFEGKSGPGKGKRVVLASGDEEYRSEEALPQLAKILSTRHGFHCTVLFAIDPADGTVNPGKYNIPGLEALASADLLIVFLRWRDLPDEQMKPFVDYFESGRPVIGLRTAGHAFNLKSSRTYERWTWNNKEWEGGFGRQVLGETWVSHHGKHGVQSTRGVIAPGAGKHPILRGIASGDIWGPTDVYTVRTPIPPPSEVLVLGQVLTGMHADDPPLEGPKNNPMMPVAWTRTFTGASGKPARVFNTTMGAATDLSNEGVRRMLVNAVYWTLGMERKIAAKSKVDVVGGYNPTPFKFGGHRPGLKPEDFAK